MAQALEVQRVVLVLVLEPGQSMDLKLAPEGPTFVGEPNVEAGQAQMLGLELELELFPQMLNHHLPNLVERLGQLVSHPEVQVTHQLVHCLVPLVAKKKAVPVVPVVVLGNQPGPAKWR